MAQWIETKVRYDKMTETGKIKKVTDVFLVDALSVSEAEARMTKEIKPYISGDFSVSAAKKGDIAEIFRNENGEYWYLVVVAFITIDEKTGSEKYSKSRILVQATDFKNAFENFLDGMKGTVADYDIVSISETKIIDVFDAELN